MRLVAVTGYGQERDLLRTRGAGFDAHVVKPYALPQLDALIRGLAGNTAGTTRWAVPARSPGGGERADGGAPEQARAGRAGQTSSSPLDDLSSREAGERLRRTHHTDESAFLEAKGRD